MIAHHIVVQVSLVRIISWSSHDECISSTLSLPFPSTSSPSHSSLKILHFFHNLEGRSNTAYFAWKEMDSLDDSYFLTGYESKSVMSPSPTTSWRFMSSPSLSPWPTHSSQSTGFPRGRGVRWHRARRYASRSTPSTCLSLPSRRFVCRSVVVVRVRANGAIRWRAIKATCWPIGQEGVKM